MEKTNKNKEQFENTFITLCLEIDSISAIKIMDCLKKCEPEIWKGLKNELKLQAPKINELKKPTPPPNIKGTFAI